MQQSQFFTSYVDEKEIEIREEIIYTDMWYRVASIGSFAFYYNVLASVDIPNSVTHIRESTFPNKNLTSVTIGSAVKSTGGNVGFDNYGSKTIYVYPNRSP